MDENLLLTAVERYLNGEMSEEEKTVFEDLRNTNPEIDQLVVEHSYFLQNIETYNSTKAFKQTLYSVETTLLAEGIMGPLPIKPRGKIVLLWKKYQRNIAVAASLTGFISILASGVMVSYTKKYGNENYRVLVDQLNKTNREVSKLKSKNVSIGIVSQKPDVDFRATGFLIDGKGYLVTNSHVISRMQV